MADASAVLNTSPVIPVVTIDDPQDAVPLARALADGGVGIIELTLRTESALTSLKLIANEVPEILVGAGTILTPGQADAAVAAGARFLVSPGVTPALLTVDFADCDAYFGPAEDGGFWALGLARPEPALLRGVPMSTPVTGAVQRERLVAAGLRVRDLPGLRDVDTAADARAVAALAPHGAFAARLADCTAGR